MFYNFSPEDNPCQDIKYLLPVRGCETYSFTVPKSIVPEIDLPYVAWFEDCEGNVYNDNIELVLDGSECVYIDRTAVAYFQVKRVDAFVCWSDEIIIVDRAQTSECAELYSSALLAGGDPAGFGSGLRAQYLGSPTALTGIDDYIAFLLFAHAIPVANSPYYGTMTLLPNNIIKWEIPEADFITAFGHTPNEVKLGFCSNGNNIFEIEVLQDFSICVCEDDPTRDFGLPYPSLPAGIGWARMVYNGGFPLQENQSIIFTYKDSECAPDNALIELRWDNPAAATILNESDFADWLILQTGGWIANYIVVGGELWLYFNIQFARRLGIELCGNFFKFCGYSYGTGYGFNPPIDPFQIITQPVCCPGDKPCVQTYPSWFVHICLPTLPDGTIGRFYIQALSLSDEYPKYYSNWLKYDSSCFSRLIRFKNKQNFAGQPYENDPLFANQVRVGIEFRDVQFAKKEVISYNSNGIIRKIYSQNNIKRVLETDYFDFGIHDDMRLALEHDSFEIYNEIKRTFVPYVLEGEYSVSTPNIRPISEIGKGKCTLVQSNKFDINSYC